ncbi:disulfide bond formation protein DsbA [Phytoactinopolyspora limicola]|uniref:mycothiol-dependent nitroreductase Rv2466c family protein n=1 Tax=Phytoactinopolyspora limicola TaxID=2715536 RepID=UPI001407868A|nr:disulfide bond formation protein DsbA [Phytoactinopolyspora limicola]
MTSGQQPGQEWTVDFWLDPSCPLSRNTARWMVDVAARRPVVVRWRVMSLSILNADKDVDPEGDESGYLWIPARVAAAVQTEHGSAALGAFYDMLWTDADGSQREWIGDFDDALRRAGLPTTLAAAGDGTHYDDALLASHRDGIGQVQGEVGTPILALAGPGRPPRAIFGPVLADVPGPEDALRLWEATVLLTAVSQFRELKA